MELNKNGIIKGPNGRPIIYDLQYKKESINAPIVIFCHGYKGFKDWGAWGLFAKTFSSNGISFLKFNFSHNGGTEKQPVDFPDLEAFAENNYTKELQDLQFVINWLCDTYKNSKAIDINNITLMGHSRGGGIVTIKASEEQRIKKLVTIASVSDYKLRFPAKMALKSWALSGVYFVKNKRTNQLMPHNYQFYKDFLQNEERLTISRAAKSLNIPHLILHGSADLAVDVSEAKVLHSWSPNSNICIIHKSNHVFGSKHPWDEPTISDDLAKVAAKTIDFINN